MHARQEVQRPKFHVHAPFHATYKWGAFWISGNPRNLRISDEAEGRSRAAGSQETESRSPSPTHQSAGTPEGQLEHPLQYDHGLVAEGGRKREAAPPRNDVGGNETQRHRGDVGYFNGEGLTT